MTRFFRAAAAILGALIATGCAKPLEVASITEIKPAVPGSSGLDIYAARRAAGEKVPDFAGDNLVDIRTYAEPDGGGLATEEIAGARCKLSARDFSAEFTTPAKVRVPVYRAQSSPLAVSCEKEGFKPRLVEVNAFNKTASDRLASASSAGVVGVVLVSAINAASDETTHDFAYPTARVVMQPIALPGKVAAKSDQ